MKLSHLFCLVLASTTLMAQGQEIVRKKYTAVPVNPHAPVIDGRMDDTCWDKACCAGDFIQRDPVEGVTPSQQTDFRVCYDTRNLFVLIRAYDSEPDKIMQEVARRDDIHRSDMVGIILDTYFDRRTAFEFTVNASGVKYDGLISNDSYDTIDESWDPVWETATSIDDSGWVVEMRIPFSQLRFAAKEEQVWGMQVYRYIHRGQESSQWQFISKNSPGYVSNFGDLDGIRGISTPRRVELLPYVVSRYNRYEPEQGNPFAPGSDLFSGAGLDGKIGFSANLTMDFTINPDFGQVEADPSEVNLTAFETFYREKRPFFIEGKNIFQFPLAIGDSDFSLETLFYSRRIGRHPQHEPDLNDDEYMDLPQQTSILGAGKVSGKTSGGWSIGVLDALTAREIAKIDSAGTGREETVEPVTNYLVGRLQKDFNRGDTYFGGLFTATNRNINKTYLDYINHSAYTGGVDFVHQWKNKTYFLDLKLAGSHVRGQRDAILELQTASARYFQRPDAEHLTLDSNRTSLSGYGGTFNIGRQGTGRWRYALGTLWRSPGFELNDVGYLRRADIAMQFIWVGYRINDPVGIFRRISVNLNQWSGWNFGRDNIFKGGNINGGGQFQNYWEFWLGINRETDGLSPYALRGGPALIYEGGWNSWVSIESDSRKSWQVEISNSNHWTDDNISHYHQYDLELFLKPSPRFNISVTPFYSLNQDNLQYVDTYQKGEADRYIMAYLDQQTFGLVFRLNYSLTPELSIQYYGQPFISTGKYSHFKRVTDSRADRYEDRFHTFQKSEMYYDANYEAYQVDEDQDGLVDYYIELPDFNFKEFKSNLVIRWEYRPGSLIYLVWSQGRSVEDSYGDFSARRDIRNLYNTVPDNIFLIKFNHWFSL